MARPPDGPAPAAAWPGQKWGWQDAAPDTGFSAPRGVERRYMRQLSSVAGQIRQIVAGSGDPARKTELLRQYAATLAPWAETTAGALARQVERRNRDAWEKVSAQISAGLRRELTAAGTGGTLIEVIRRNAKAIKDLPLGAADKVADLAAGAVVSGMRAETLTKRIAEVGETSHAEARRIARTEVSKASSAFTRSRAEAVGSDGYIWRTARDGDVRESHRAMEGKFVRWDDPQRLDGLTGHAGEIPNCRCYPEPVIPQPGVTGAASASRTFASPLPTAEETAADPQKGLLSPWEMIKKEVVPHSQGDPLPGADRAVLDVAKLARYALDPSHPSGGPKARVLSAALGARPEDAESIRAQILAQLPEVAAARPDIDGGAVRTDRDGERFRVRLPVTGPNGRTVEVVTGWIYDRPRGRRQEQSGAPRLVTMYLPGKEAKDVP